MGQAFVSVLFGVGWLLAVSAVVNDLRILRRGRIDEETNATDIPARDLPESAQRPGPVRGVSTLRLVFGIVWVVLIPVLLIRAWLN